MYVLSFTPRPAYQNDDLERVYGTTVFDLEVKWKQFDNRVTVIEIKR